MINKHELIFAVDENNNPIEPMERHKAHAEGIWHRTTDIVVVNSKNQILCNKRSMLKDSGPGLWDAAFGGHILADTDPTESAKQELFEESSLKATTQDLEFVCIIKHERPQNKEFRYFYIYRWDGNLADLKLEKDEVDEAKWLDLEAVAQNRDNPSQWVPMPYIDELLKKFDKKS